jgi:hypothetical protein
MTEDDFRRDAAAKGYAEPVEKTWDAGQLNSGHTHEHTLYLRIATGTMILGIETDAGLVTTSLTPGGTIDVPADCHHSEQAGPEGVTFLVASK